MCSVKGVGRRAEGVGCRAKGVGFSVYRGVARGHVPRVIRASKAHRVRRFVRDNVVEGRDDALALCFCKVWGLGLRF